MKSKNEMGATICDSSATADGEETLISHLGFISMNLNDLKVLIALFTGPKFILKHTKSQYICDLIRSDLARRFLHFACQDDEKPVNDRSAPESVPAESKHRREHVCLL